MMQQSRGKNRFPDFVVGGQKLQIPSTPSSRETPKFEAPETQLLRMGLAGARPSILPLRFLRLLRAKQKQNRPELLPSG